MTGSQKARLLDAPISQAGLFRDTVEDVSQQFSAVKQAKVIKHTVSCPSA